MIIWRGWGLIVFVAVFGAAYLSQLTVDAILGTGYYSDHKWTIAIALFLGAALCWASGRWLRKRDGQPEGKSPHALFFIPVEYWAPVLAVAAVGYLIAEFVG